jgi:hypothetical protein
VDDSFFVRGFERFRNLSRDGDCLAKRESSSLNPRGQRLAVDEFEDEESMSIYLFETVNARDVLMIQRGEHMRLTAEARQPFRILRHAVRQRFHSDVTTEARIPRSIHLSPTARAEQAHDLVRSELGSQRQRHGLQALQASVFQSSRPVPDDVD